MMPLGCSKLARVEEDIVIAFTEYGSEDNTRLTVQLNRAYDVGLTVQSDIFDASDSISRKHGREITNQPSRVCSSPMFGAACTSPTTTSGQARSGTFSRSAQAGGTSL